MESAPKPEIVSLNQGLIESLEEFFEEIGRSDDPVLFHPHPFVRSEAERLCNYQGKDLYYVLLLGRRILAYGMLRGWDEGYSVPSLGIIVREEARGQGLGKLLMLHLHVAARLRGADRIRLKVYKKNEVARRMYEGLGYVFDLEEGDQVVGFFEPG